MTEPRPATESMTAGLPAVLLPYQQDLVAAVEQPRSVVVVEKSRRTGYSWTAAAIAALHARAQRFAETDLGVSAIGERAQQRVPKLERTEVETGGLDIAGQRSGRRA